MIRNIIEAIKNQNQMVGNTPAQQLLERENAEYLEMLYNLTNKRTLGDFKLDSFNLIMTGEQLNKCVKFFNDLLGNNQNIFEIMNAPFRSAYLEMTVLNASMMFETILIPMFKNIQATFLIQFNKSFDYAFGAGILAKRTSSLVGYDITDKIQ